MEDGFKENEAPRQIESLKALEGESLSETRQQGVPRGIPERVINEGYAQVD